MSSTKLREFIRQVRACKSAAEERAVVAKECAKIRTNFKNEGSHRQRDVAKVLFIALLGHPTQFAQVECLKLVASSKFGEKRVGYLGLTLLLDETSEVSLLATNSFKRDLQHSNQYVNGLALSALANAGSTDACRELLGEVEALLTCSNPFVRKKAAAAAARCCRRVPEAAAARFQETLSVLFNDRCHGVLLGGCSLLGAVLDANPDARLALKEQLLPQIVKALRSCCASASSVAGAQSGEYDIAGVSDPLLQARLLRAVSRLCQGEPPESPALAEALAFVATNTDATKNAGCCVLYECVVALLKMKADEGLRVLGTNILGRFLSSRDQNFRYIALGTLKHLVATDPKAVAKYKETILDCLKGSDSSICRRALDVLVNVMDSASAPSLVRELLSFLLVCEAEHKRVVAEKLAAAVLRHAPTQRWCFDNSLKLLCVAGGYLSESLARSLLEDTRRCVPLHSYAVHRFFFCLREGGATCPWLAATALDCVGEFGELLVASNKTSLLDDQQQTADAAAAAALSLTEKDVALCVSRFATALSQGRALTPPPRSSEGGPGGAAAEAEANASKTLVSGALISCAAKLATKLASQREVFLNILRHFSSSAQVELQQRSTEYLALLELDAWKDEVASLFGRMPAPPKRKEAFGLHPATEAASSASLSLLSGEEAQPERPVGPLCFDVGDIPLETPETAVADEMLLNGGGAAPPCGGGIPSEVSLLSLDVGSPSPPTAKASLSSPAGELEVLSDLFAASFSASLPSGAAPPAAASAVSAKEPPVCPSPSVDPFASLLEECAAPGPSAPESSSASPATKPPPLAALAAAEAESRRCVVTALDESEGIHVELLCQTREGGGCCDVEARVSYRGNDAPLQNLRLEAAVPKYLTLEMLPPSGDCLSPGRGVVVQRMRVSPALAAEAPGGGSLQLLMKCRLSFTRNSLPEQRLMRVETFPPDLLKGL